MNAAGRAALAAAASTIALGIALGAGALRPEAAVAAYVLALACILLTALVRSLVEAARVQPESAFEAALRRSAPLEVRPAELVRVERDLTLGLTSAGGADLRLLPLLREAAAARLLARRGIELDRRPELARAALGDEAWELLRPDRPLASDRNGPGLREAQVRAVVDALERV